MPRRPIKHPILVVIVLIVSIGVVHLLRTERSLSSITYAFQLFGTLIHEIGHSVAALLSGGSVHGFVVNANSGGHALTSGGNWAVILPAGYVGSAIFGSIFFYLANRYRWADLFGFLIGLFIVGFTVAFGRPEENGNMTAHYVAIGFGVILLALGYKGPLWLNMLLVNIIATLTALQGLMGAWTLHVLSEDWHHNDAVMFAQAFAPQMGGNTVALVWAAFSVICFAIASFGVLRTIRHGHKWKWNYI
jgi:hypothetical protein